MKDVRVAPKTLVEKWSSPARGKVGVGNIANKHIKENCAAVLENQQRQMLSEASFNTGISSLAIGAAPKGNLLPGGKGMGAYGPLGGMSMALVRQTFPALFANKILSVQAMNGPAGIAAALRPYYVDPVTRAATELAGWDYVPQYSGFTGWIKGSSAYNSPATTGQAVAELSAVSGSADMGIAADPQFAEHWMLGGTNRTIPTTAFPTTGYGIEKLEGAQVPTSAEAYPEITLQLETESILAKTRKLAASVSLESVTDLQNVWSVDVKKELLAAIQYELVAEQDREILQAIKSVATQAEPITVSSGTDAAGTMVNRGAELVAKILRLSNIIIKTTHRFAGNFAIVSPDVATLLQTAPTSVWSKTETQIVGFEATPEIGTINGTIKVYLDQYAQKDYVLVGYKGTALADSGIVYCPYVTNLVAEATDPRDFSPRLGVMNRYALCTSLLGANRYYIYADVDLGDTFGTDPTSGRVDNIFYRNW